jgi:hypothetical protein
MKHKLAIGLYAAGAVALAGIGFSSYVLVMGIGRLNDTRKKLDATAREVGRYYDQKPFASDENIAAQKKNVLEIDGAFSNLVQQLKTGQVEPSGSSPAVFMDMLAERRNKLESAGRAKGVVMPSGFAFGFDRYFQRGSALPDKNNVPRLNQQLTMVESLCNELFKERIRINGLGREEFEEGGSGPAAPSPGHRSRVAGAGGVQILNRANPQSGVKAPGELWAKMRFILDCSGKEQAILNVLNHLAKNPMFVVVTFVSIEKEGPDVRMYVPPKPAETNAAARAAAGAGRGDKPPTRSDRLLCGRNAGDLEAPVHARIEMDVYMQWGE